MGWYLKVLRNYAVFRGRASRKEYWMFGLINFIIWLALALINGIIFAVLGYGQHTKPLLPHIYSLAVLIPMIAVGIRRLHDTNRSGWWMLIGLIPIVGFIVLLIFYVQDSQPGENQYGPNPKAVTA